MEQGIYDANQLATQSQAGQMSKDDKKKMDGLAIPEITGTQIEF